MATQPTSGRDVLEKYRQSDPKYVIAPVPSRVDRDEATRFVCDYATNTEPVGQFRKLGDLAVFHNLTGTVPTFEKLQAKRESQTDDYRRSALAAATIAWIGDDKQVDNAQRYYRAMLGWTPVESNVAWLARTCDALGPREGTARFKKWIEDEIAKLDEKKTQHEQNQQNDEATAAKRRIEDLRSVLGRDVPQMDANNDVRKQLDAVQPAVARVPRLVELYVDTTVTSNERQSYWAAICLLRLSESSAALREAIGREFLKRAPHYVTPPDPERQDEFDLNRACCLRAAEFFGQSPTDPDAEWLKEHEDYGTALLVLRPDWAY